jgi:hypothetical protein
MNIDPAIAVNALIKQGVMLKAAPDTLFRTDKNHCVILLNVAPHSDTHVVFVCASSQYTKRIEYAIKVNLPVETIVMVKPNSYHHLPKYSAIDCNQVFVLTKGELAALYVEKRISFYQKSRELTEEDMSKVTRGVLASPTVNDEIKKLIREE